MKGDALSTRHSCQNTRKAPLMHFLCKEIKHLKSISGKYLMLPLRLQENNRNIELLYQVTAVSACAPPENKHLPCCPGMIRAMVGHSTARDAADAELKEPGRCQQQTTSSPAFSVCPSNGWKGAYPGLSLPWPFRSFFLSFSHSG